MREFVAKCNDQIQHVSLSRHAYSTICSDSVTFLGKINLSGFINRIVRNSIDDPLPPSVVKTAIATKDRISKNIRLNNSVFSDLYPLNGRWFGYKDFKSPGTYINAVLEQYAHKTFFFREKIFYKDTLDTLLAQSSIPEQERRIFKITLSSGAQYDFKFLRVSADYEGLYHYLIGQSAECNTKRFQTASFRLSRISDIRPRGLSHGSGHISRKVQIEIEDEIEMKGVEYLVGRPCSFSIKLSKNGEKLYNSVFHLRPIYERAERDADGTLTINLVATEKQIYDYFFKFGKDAIILYPERVRQLFSDSYKNACQQYQ